MQAQSNDPVSYKIAPTRASIIEQALAMLDAELRAPGAAMCSPKAVRDYLTLHNGSFQDQNIERFSVMWLDSQNRLIATDMLFTGTLTQTSVYPREVVRSGLQHNAASCVLSHNHPSGVCTPSRADESLTKTLKSALALVDIRLLDHIITSGGQSCSMAELGLT